MRIISFDVGMKNLAYCILTIPDNNELLTTIPKEQHIQELMQHIKIEKWDVIDLRFEPSCPQEKPEIKHKKLCNNDSKQAKYMFLPNKQPNSNTHLTAKLYCAKCAEKSKYKIPDREIMPIRRNLSLLQKKKLDDLMDIYSTIVPQESISGSYANSDTNNSSNTNNKKIRKIDKINDIETILKRDYLETLDDNKYEEYIGNNNCIVSCKKSNYAAHDLDLITYGRHLMKHMDAILHYNNTNCVVGNDSNTFLPIDMMIIENQISTIATRMKTLQGMITQYFIMKHVPRIEFISASCKLKLCTDSMMNNTIDATSYSDRKKAGITICRYLGTINYIIQKNETNEPVNIESTCSIYTGKIYSEWLPMFETHKKKDDLADCFLQCLWKVNSLLGG
jgi:hypothetical protein